MLKRAFIVLLVTVINIPMSFASSDNAQLKHDEHMDPKTQVAAAPEAVKPKIVSRTIKLRSFNKIDIHAPVDVEIIANTTNHDIRMIGDEEAINKVSIKESASTLKVGIKDWQQIKHHLVIVIRASRLYDLKYEGNGDLTAIGLNSAILNVHTKTPGKVKLSGPRVGLHMLTLDGTGPIDITGIKADNLTIYAKGANHVTMRGEANVRAINFCGVGHTDLYWADSPYLHVIGSDDATFDIAGSADLLEVKLTDNAHFNARYLRVKRVFVKTYNNAVAEIQTTDSQNTLAKDESNIYFYKNAKFHGDFMGNSGSVLNMNGMS